MTDRFNTIAGWVLFAGIVALGLSIVSGMYFGGDKPHRPHEMGYPIEGLGNAEERANVILYLRENGGGPPLPEPPAAEPEEGAEGAAAGPEDAAGADAAGAVAQPEPAADQSAATANE